MAWAAVLPPWQGPDEPAHYWYASQLSHGRLVFLGEDRAGAPPELTRSLQTSGFDLFRSRDPGRPFTAALRTLLATPAASGAPVSAGDLRGAAGYPPAYYVAVLPAWGVAHAPEVRLALGRLVSALFSGLLAYLTFGLVLELTQRPRLSLAGAVLVGMPPMIGQASGILNPDIMLAAGTAGLALACVRVWGRPERLRVAAVVAWWALVACTKPIGIALATVTAVSFLALPPLARLRGRGLAAAGGAGAAAALAGAAYVVFSPSRRATADFTLDYLGDFYAPRSSAGVVDVWIRSGMGRFGWLLVTLPAWAIAVGVASILVAVAVAVAGPAAFPLTPAARAGVLACAVAVVAYVAVLHGVAVHSLLNEHGGILQGRYLTAIAPIAVAGFLTLASRLPRRRCAALCAGLCLVWLVLSLDALDTVVRYYAT